MKPKSLAKAINEIQLDYERRRRTIKDDIPQSGLTDVLQQRILDYSNFIRSLESLKEAVLQMRRDDL